jgi:hypothetical protein
MTVFVAANMTGSNKLPLLFIGKSEKPHKMYLLQNLDFNYYHNPTARMNIMILIDFVEKLNMKLIKNSPNCCSSIIVQLSQLILALAMSELFFYRLILLLYYNQRMQA